MCVWERVLYPSSLTHRHYTDVWIITKKKTFFLYISEEAYPSFGHCKRLHKDKLIIMKSIIIPKKKIIWIWWWCILKKHFSSTDTWYFLNYAVLNFFPLCRMHYYTNKTQPISCKYYMWYQCVCVIWNCFILSLCQKHWNINVQSMALYNILMLDVACTIIHHFKPTLKRIHYSLSYNENVYLCLWDLWGRQMQL